MRHSCINQKRLYTLIPPPLVLNSLFLNSEYYYYSLSGKNLATHTPPYQVSQESTNALGENQQTHITNVDCAVSGSHSRSGGVEVSNTAQTLGNVNGYGETETNVQRDSARGAYISGRGMEGEIDNCQQKDQGTDDFRKEMDN